ncbi:TIGR02449 family protein [uncultured Pseudoteredinibacter sp.]|uniref:TIGR02449 family protein n=1 Tax=uncultured Pseudoteredinibacter sp. TaxID=1641701 RepID=UPI0026071518|nr:TIGR02449 family protein [uncultured Pseudoteredinibacter sp.]MCV6622273.1 TIGR02449 family protein [Cellvibrionaceae bacterium]
MTDLKQLEEKLDLLIQRCHLLQQENDVLKQERQQWQSDKSRLIEKNELARTRVEAMIGRLKELEAGAN